MKINLVRKAKQLAATLMVTLFICSILGVSTLGYLMLVQQQNTLSVRSQSWNLTIALVEAGVEEGLQQLNEHFDNLATSGWVPYGPNAYTCDRTMPGGSYRVYIYLTNGVSSPVIVATATVDMRLWVMTHPSSMLAAAGVTGDAAYITRTVKVVCYRGGDFPNAIVAKDKIEMHGNNVKVDSFKSCEWPDGKYAPERALSKGDVASNGSVIDAGNANIYGHVATGPGGKVQVGSQGAVGSYEWQSSGNKGIQPGWASDTSNFNFKDTSLPYSSGSYPAGGEAVTAEIVGGSSNIVSTVYPNPPPITGVITNIHIVSVSTIPNPVPDGLKTITTPTTVISLPSPTPYGVVTNTQMQTSSGYPASGTYLGTVSTNMAGKKIKNYTYNAITGYTYPVTSYTYPAIVYSYSVYTTNTIYTTNTYDHILDSGEYYADSLTGSILVRGDATLVLPNGFDIGSGTLTIANNARISVYAGGNSCSLSGNQVINRDGLASSFILYCAPSVKGFSFSLSGNAGITGVIYAPYADFSLNGGGKDTLDFVGALVVNSITLNGHFNVHYDECLNDQAANSLFVVKSWDEIY